MSTLTGPQSTPSQQLTVYCSVSDSSSSFPESPPPRVVWTPLLPTLDSRNCIRVELTEYDWGPAGCGHHVFLLFLRNAWYVWVFHVMLISFFTDSGQSPPVTISLSAFSSSLSHVRALAWHLFSSPPQFFVLRAVSSRQEHRIVFSPLPI